MNIPDPLYKFVNCAAVLALFWSIFYPHDTTVETEDYTTSYTSYGVDATAEVHRKLTLTKSFFGLNLNVTKIDDVTVTLRCRSETTIVQTYVANSSDVFDTNYQRAYSCVEGDNIILTHNNQKSDGNLLLISAEHVDRWNPSRKAPFEHEELP